MAILACMADHAEHTSEQGWDKIRLFSASMMLLSSQDIVKTWDARLECLQIIPLPMAISCFEDFSIQTPEKMLDMLKRNLFLLMLNRYAWRCLALAYQDTFSGLCTVYTWNPTLLLYPVKFIKNQAEASAKWQAWKWGMMNWCLHLESKLIT